MRSDIGRVGVLRDLRPVVEAGLERHRIESSVFRPEDFLRPEMYWGSRTSTLTESAKAALVTTLLMEQNVPFYRRDQRSTPGESSAWAMWIEEWSGERTLHARSITDYLVATRSVDPNALDRARAQCLTIGSDTPIDAAHLLRSLVHVTLDVLVTGVCHRNTAALCHDPVADRLLARIVADQRLHATFFGDLVAAALELSPATTVRSITEVVMNFQLPGTQLSGFGRSAMLMERDGIYDLRHHLDDVVLPLLHRWQIFDRADLGCGEYSRVQLLDHLDHLESQAAVPAAAGVRSRMNLRLRAS